MPFFKDPNQVVELDKLYFFLDDDNNFKPNLFHHGMFIFYIKGLEHTHMTLFSIWKNKENKPRIDQIQIIRLFKKIIFY